MLNKTRQRREKQTPIMKSLILEKAGLLFWQKGYNNTSMKDIASVCECKPANFYNYFSGKEDILFEVIKDISERSVSSIIHLAEDEITDPIDQLQMFIKNHFNLHINLEQNNVMLSDTGLRHLSKEHQEEIIKLRDFYESILRKILQRGKASGLFSPHLDEKIVSYIIPSMIIRSSLWYTAKGRLSLEQISDIMINFTLYGISALHNTTHAESSATSELVPGI